MPLRQELALGSDVPVLGFGMEDLDVPLHRVRLRSDLLSGDVMSLQYLVVSLLTSWCASFQLFFPPALLPSQSIKKSEGEIGLSDSFLCGNDDAVPPAGSTEVGVSNGGGELFVDRFFFVKDGVLMRKITPLCASPADDWCVTTQIVVPQPY